MLRAGKRKSGNGGFTLIELMIAVAIVAILAKVAYPSFQSMILKSHRADGQGALQALQLAQEKYRVNNTSYSGALTDSTFARVCPSSGNCYSPNGYYQMTVSGTSATGYTLTATAVGTQANDTSCATMTIVQDATSITYSPTACWSK